MHPTHRRLCGFLHPTFLRSSPLPKHPRPRPGTAERPPYRAPDPLVGNPNAVVTQLELSKEGGQQLTFIHRPPPTAPSPYSTVVAPTSPLLKPRGVQRPQIQMQEVEQETTCVLPPLIRPSKQEEEKPCSRMSEDAITRLKHLRRSDPVLYTRGKLAKMFGCTPTFVGMVAPLKKFQCRETHRVLKERHQVARDGWSEKHQMVMEIRKRRKELW